MGVGAVAGLAGAGQTGDCRRAELPACAFLEACRVPGSSFEECEPSGECTFVFQESLSGPLLEVHLDCQQIAAAAAGGDNGSWELSEDGLTLLLGAGACDRWRAEGDHQLVVQSIHSCLR